MATWRQSFALQKISGVERLRNRSRPQLITNVVSSESTPVGLPGGVFMTKFYISGEPVSEAQTGHETLGLQGFQKGWGVIELIMPTRELNFTSEVDTISRALQAVNLTATNVPIIPRLKVSTKTLRVVTDKEMENDAMGEFQKNKKVKTRKPMARRSPVWKSFTVVMVGDTIKAKCNHCDLELCCHSKIHGTSSLKSHLERCKLNPSNRITGPL